MHYSLLTAIIIVIIFIVVIWFSRCPCGCARWCSCAKNNATKCCCITEPMVNNRRLVTLHYTNWCTHCTNMKPVWAAVKIATEGSGIQFKEVDEDIAKTPGIDGYPTIIMIDELGYKYQYLGGPDFEKLRNWIVSPKAIGS